jgi:hypothetical protein
MASIISAGTTSGTALNMAGDTSGVLQLATNGSTTAITIDTSQNVGIGTAIPNSKLHVSSGAATITGASSTTARINMFNNAATTGGLLLGQGYASGTDNIGYIFNVSNAAVVFGTNDTERMRVTSDGKIFMGAATAQRGTERLSMSASGMDGIVVVTDSAGLIVRKTSFGNGFLCLFENSGGTQVGAITSNGTNTTYTTSSDYRLKENIAPMVGALDTVTALKPVTYKWKATGEDGQGFIAHELQAVVPDAVVGEKDAVDEEGNIKPQGVDTSFLVATLTAAIQEQQIIINDLKARITALEGAA